MLSWRGGVCVLRVYLLTIIGLMSLVLIGCNSPEPERESSGLELISSETTSRGIAGAEGAQGPKGDTGPQGPVGPQGPKAWNSVYCAEWVVV